MKQKGSRRKISIVLRWVLWVLLAQFILVNISAALYAYKLTHFYTDGVARTPARNSNIFVKTWRLFTGPRFGKSVISDRPVADHRTIRLETKSGLSISAWYIPADSVARGTVILVHGITANKSYLLPEASEFRIMGYNVLLLDLRAHGDSEGQTTTLGVKETEECKAAYDFLVNQGEKNIFLYGSSLGAVVVAKAVAEHNLQPSGIMLDMPFGSLQTHLQARARLLGFSGFPEKPFGFLVTAWISMERGFNGFKHRTADYTSQLKGPLLMQWGAQDPVVLKKETDRIFNNIGSDLKKLVVYEEAGHESLLEKDPARWRAEMRAFLSVFHQG